MHLEYVIASYVVVFALLAFLMVLGMTWRWHHKKMVARLEAQAAAFKEQVAAKRVAKE